MCNRVVKLPGFGKSISALFIALAAILTAPLMAKDEVKTQEFPQPAFSAISIHLPADFEIRMANRNSVTVSAEPKVIAALRLGVRSNVLKLDSASFQTVLPIKILIEAKQIESLSLHSSGSITVHNLVANRFVVSSDSSAEISVLGLSSDALKMSVSGSETIKLTGKTNSFELRAEGSSDVDASKLVAQFAVVTVSGASTAHVNTTSELRATASDSANIKYQGSGRIKKQVSEAAEIAKAN